MHSTHSSTSRLSPLLKWQQNPIRVLSRIINGSRASNSRLTFVPFSRLSAAYAHFRWGVSGNNIILSRSFKGRPTRYLLMAGKRALARGAARAGQAEVCRGGERLGKNVAHWSASCCIFRPVWLFRFAISSVSSFRIVCRSASSFDVLRSCWYRRMFSSCTKSCKFITCFSVRIACEAVCWDGISAVSRCASQTPNVSRPTQPAFRFGCPACRSTQASLANHSCSVRQIGQYERAKNTGMDGNRAGSIWYWV